MPKAKPPTPQELYRQRREREEQEKTAYLPPGLINHGNTCFMNSVLQGLIATRLLSDLVHFYPISAHTQAKAATPILSHRSPQLTNGHNIAGLYEQPWVNMMPIGDMFLSVLYRAWGMQSRRQREVLSPKSLLTALGQKYDQYLDFAQQDAHEFLRILLDAMRMEEQDVIKKRQPPPPHSHHKKRRRTTITPGNSTTARPPSALPGSATAPQPSEGSPLVPNDIVSPTSGNPSDPNPVPLLSFADMLFGGQLTSILVCQKCKHISQTYEDFNDISLSIKAEDYYSSANRKRDRFKNFAKRLTAFPTPGSSSNGKDKRKEKGKDKPTEHPSISLLSTPAAGSSATQTPSASEPTPNPAPTHIPTPIRLPVAPFHALEIQRSSSVPPSPSVERPGGTITGGHDEPPVLIVERRRSLDLGLVRKMSQKGDEDGSTTTASNTVEDGGASADEQDEGFVTPDERFIDAAPAGTSSPMISVSISKEEDKREKEEDLSSSSSHIIVNVTGPDDRHVEFVESSSKGRGAEVDKSSKSSSDKDASGKEEGGKEKKEPEEATWTKISRRISLTVGGLGRRTASDKKERERKSRSMDKSGLAIKEEASPATSDGPIQKSASVGVPLPAPVVNDSAPSPEPSNGEKGKLGTDPSTTSLAASVNKLLKPLPARPASIAQESKPPSRTSTPPPVAAPTGVLSSSNPTATATPPSNRGRPAASPPQNVTAPPMSGPTTSTESTSSSRPLSRFPSVLPPRRSKSPKPPKPSPGEAEYLRRILADVGTASFGGSPLGGASGSASNLNPFALLKPPALGNYAPRNLHLGSLHHGHSERREGDGKEKEKDEGDKDKNSSTSAPHVPIPLTHSASSSAASWLGFGVGPHLSGIEECLRMFTSVEVLDGENMVGCRRCWKIEHGMLGKGKERRIDEDDQDSDEEKEEQAIAENDADEDHSTSRTFVGGGHEVDFGVLSATGGVNRDDDHIPHQEDFKTVKGRQPRPALSHLTSLSKDGLSVQDGDDPSGLKEPTSADPLSTADHQSMSLAVIPPTPLDATRPSPKDPSFPIPVISTTAPEGFALDPADLSDQETPFTDRDSAYARLTGGSPSGSKPPKEEPSPITNPKVTQSLYGSGHSSGSKDSLVIPSVARPKSIRRRSTQNSQLTGGLPQSLSSTTGSGSGTDRDDHMMTTTDDDDSELESDTSVETSVSASSSRGNNVAQSTPAPPALGRATSSLSYSKTIRRPSMPPHGSSTSSPAVPSRTSSLGLSSSTTISTGLASTPPIGSTSPPSTSTPPKPSSSKPAKQPKPVIMRPAYKRYLIATPPPVLVVHLKRFQQTSKTAFYSTFSHGFKKLDDYVSFPEYLDLTPFLAPKKEDYGLGKKGKSAKKGREKEKARMLEDRCVYRLYAVVVHIGNMLGGHYIAYTALPDSPPVRPTAPPSNAGAASPAKSSTSTSSGQQGNADAKDTSPKKSNERQWAYVSDTVVRLTTLEEVLHSKAYICMYERIV